MRGSCARLHQKSMPLTGAHCVLRNGQTISQSKDWISRCCYNSGSRSASFEPRAPDRDKLVSRSLSSLAVELCRDGLNAGSDDPASIMYVGVGGRLPRFPEDYQRTTRGLPKDCQRTSRGLLEDFQRAARGLPEEFNTKDLLAGFAHSLYLHHH